MKNNNLKKFQQKQNNKNFVYNNPTSKLPQNERDREYFSHKPKNLDSNCPSPNSKNPSRSNSAVKSKNKIPHNEHTHMRKPSDNNIPKFEVTDLLFNLNDDQKTLINKNTKLRNLLIQASNKISEMSIKKEEKEKEYQIEKSKILQELDRITINYKTYAEGYKKFSFLDEQFKNLKNDYQHNYNVLVSYGESLRYDIIYLVCF